MAKKSVYLCLNCNVHTMCCGALLNSHTVCGNIVSICTTHGVGHYKTHTLWVGTLSVSLGTHHVLWGTVKLIYCV